MTKVIAVIHHISNEVTLQNAAIARAAGAAGVALIQMQARDVELDEPARVLRALYPASTEFMIGCNRLNAWPDDAIHQDFELGLDFTWQDNPGVSSLGVTTMAEVATAALASLTRPFLFFGSVAFKTQAHETAPAAAALYAADLGWVVTTSGVATGIAPDCEKLRAMREAIGERPLAVASGVTPDNVNSIARFVDFIFVATGVSVDFYHLSPELLQTVVERARNATIDAAMEATG